MFCDRVGFTCLFLSRTCPEFHSQSSRTPSLSFQSASRGISRDSTFPAPTHELVGYPSTEKRAIILVLAKYSLLFLLRPWLPCADAWFVPPIRKAMRSIMVHSTPDLERKKRGPLKSFNGQLYRVLTFPLRSVPWYLKSNLSFCPHGLPLSLAECLAV